MKVYAIDFDGTLMDKQKKPITKNIEKVRAIYSNDDKENSLIIVYTARNDTIENYILVKSFLETNKIPYHLIKLGKLKGDFYIDDKMLKW